MRRHADAEASDPGSYPGGRRQAALLDDLEAAEAAGPGQEAERLREPKWSDFYGRIPKRSDFYGRVPMSSNWIGRLL